MLPLTGFHLPCHLSKYAAKSSTSAITGDTYSLVHIGWGHPHTPLLYWMEYICVVCVWLCRVLVPVRFCTTTKVKMLCFTTWIFIVSCIFRVWSSSTHLIFPNPRHIHSLRCWVWQCAATRVILYEYSSLHDKFGALTRAFNSTGPLQNWWLRPCPQVVHNWITLWSKWGIADNPGAWFSMCTVKKWPSINIPLWHLDN